jgi:hypothetical protein
MFAQYEIYMPVTTLGTYSYTVLLEQARDGGGNMAAVFLL